LGGKNGKQVDGWKWKEVGSGKTKVKRKSSNILTAAYFGRELMEVEKFDNAAKYVELKKYFKHANNVILWIIFYIGFW
jgi:hypothetical protein